MLVFRDDARIAAHESLVADEEGELAELALVLLLGLLHDLGLQVLVIVAVDLDGRHLATRRHRPQDDVVLREHLLAAALGIEAFI